MGFAFILENKISTSIEELLIVGSVERIVVEADRIQFPQFEAYGRRRGRDATWRPSDVEELEGSRSYSFECPHAHTICEAGGFNFQPVAMPFSVGVKRRTADTAGKVVVPQTHDCSTLFVVCFYHR